MKCILVWYLIFGVWYLNVPEVKADLPPLRTQDTVRVDRGKTRFSAVMSDDNGEVFLEVPQGMNAKIAGQAYFNFDGFLLAPSIVSLPNEFPLKRTREIVNFEFLADSGEPVHFSDKFFAVPLKRRLFIENEKTKSITAYIPIRLTENVRQPELWYYDENLTDDDFGDEWRLIGGVYEDTSDPDVRLFSAVLTRTGLYSLIDRRPLPRDKDIDTIDPEIIDLVADSPFPSVEPDPDAPIEGDVGEEDLLENQDLFGDGTQFIGGSEGAIPFPVEFGDESELIDGNEDEIPAVSPLDEETGSLTDQGLLPTIQGATGLDNELDDLGPEIPSLEEQQGLSPEDLQISTFEDDQESEIGNQEPVEEIDPESLPQLTEAELLAQLDQLEEIPPEAIEAFNNGDLAALQASLFESGDLEASEITESENQGPEPQEGGELPRSGNEKTILFLSLVVIAGSIYYYRKEKQEMLDETR